MTDKPIDENKIRFSPDRGLMYLIQQITKEPSDEILGFFFDFGKEAIVRVLESIQKRSQSSFKRTIENYYPNTSIPFMLKVEGYLNRDENNERQMHGATITVSFPENTEYINTKDMMEMIVEKQLLGGSQIPNFEPPETFASNGFKGLVKEILGKRHGQTLLDSGHTRTTGPSEEALGRTPNKT